MNPSEEFNPLDALFHEHVPRVQDRGFTARVLKSLPARRRRWLSPALLFAAAAVGSVFAGVWVPWGNLPALDSSDLLSPSAQILLPWTTALAVAGSLIWSALAAVLRSEL